LAKLEICTFTPKTNRTKILFNNSKKNVYKRLYEDNNRRLRNQSLKRKSQEKNFDDLSSKKHKKKLNFKHLEKLYDDHMNKFKTDNTFKRTYYNQEAGVTFKPFHMSEEKNKYSKDFNSILNSRNEFFERNENCLKSKHIYSELYNKILREALQQRRSYAAYEIEKIRKNVLERLYFKEIEKIKAKNNWRFIEKNHHENSKNAATRYLSGSPVSKTPLNFQEYLRCEFYQNQGMYKKFNFSLKDRNFKKSQSKSREKSLYFSNSHEMRFDFSNKINTKNNRSINRKEMLNMSYEFNSNNDENSSSQQTNLNNVFTFKADRMDLVGNGNDSENNYFLNQSNNSFPYKGKQEINEKNWISRMKDDKPLGQNLFEESNLNKNGKVFNDNKKILKNKLNNQSNNNFDKKNNSEKTALVKTKQIIKNNLKNSYDKGNEKNINKNENNNQDYNKNKDENNYFGYNQKSTEEKINSSKSQNELVEKYNNTLNNNLIRNNINIEYDALSKTLQNYCNSQYCLNTLGEHISDNVSKIQNNENNGSFNVNLIENENSKKKSFRKNLKNKNLEINFINYTNFTSPKNMTSTKSTNQNNNNILIDKINNKGDNIQIKEGNVKREEFIKINEDRNFNDLNNSIKKINQIANTIQETINLDNELENFQNYTNINSEIGHNNTNSSKSKFLYQHFKKIIFYKLLKSLKKKIPFSMNSINNPN